MDNRNEYAAFVPGFSANFIHPMHTIQASKLLNDYLMTGAQQAEDRYYKLTFSVMFEINAGSILTNDTGVIRTPIIVSAHESLASLRMSIESTIGIPLYALIVVWESGGDEWDNTGRFFSASQQDCALIQKNIFPMLRLMQQRGGVDKVVSNERDATEPYED